MKLTALLQYAFNFTFTLAISVEHHLVSDGQTDRQTYDDFIHRVSIASLGKIFSSLFSFFEENCAHFTAFYFRFELTF